MIDENTHLTLRELGRPCFSCNSISTSPSGRPSMGRVSEPWRIDPGGRNLHVPTTLLYLIRGLLSSWAFGNKRFSHVKTFGITRLTRLNLFSRSTTRASPCILRCSGRSGSRTAIIAHCEQWSSHAFSHQHSTKKTFHLRAEFMLGTVKQGNRSLWHRAEEVGGCDGFNG